MSTYSSLSAASVKLIAQFGRTFDLLCASATLNDGAKPWRGTTTAGTLKASPKGVFASFDAKELQGERIQATDIKVLVAAADPAFATADVGFTIGGVLFADDQETRYGATEVNDIMPGDTDLVRIFRLRRL